MRTEIEKLTDGRRWLCGEDRKVDEDERRSEMNEVEEDKLGRLVS